MSDAEILSAYPGVLALVPPRIGSPIVLPPTPETFGLGDANDAGPGSDGPEPDRAAVLREALRLRARWVQELTAKVAEELGRRLAAKGVLADADQVRHLRLDELTAVVHGGRLPDDIDARGLAAGGAPLPTRFRLTEQATVVPVAGRSRRRGRIGGSHGAGAGAGAGTGAGGGRGMGPVHAGDGPPEPGSVLVVRTLDPNLAAVLPRLGGLVAETGSFLSHLAILARELNIPTVVGVEDAIHRFRVEDALDRFPGGTVVLVDGTTGEVSRVSQPVER